MELVLAGDVWQFPDFGYVLKPKSRPESYSASVAVVNQIYRVFSGLPISGHPCQPRGSPEVCRRIFWKFGSFKLTFGHLAE